MSVRFEGVIKRYSGNSHDEKPRPGVVGQDGITPTAADVTVGTTFIEHDTGRTYRWDGAQWQPPVADDTLALLLGELVAETNAVRKGIELALGLNFNVHIDLRTEDVTQLQDS